VIALELAEHRRPCATLDLIPIDYRVGLLIGSSLRLEDRLVIERLLRIRQIIDLVTGLLAPPAADTERGIVENTAGVGIAGKFLVRCSSDPGYSNGRPCGGHALEKASA
jgi:hypothetical protein